MRELKVRAWSKKHNRYLKITGIQYDDDKIAGVFVINGKIAGIPNTIFLEYEDIVLEPSTGLKDKNGKEIYVGDIVLHHKMMSCSQEFFGTMKCNGVVKWDDEKTGYYPFNGYDIQWDLNYLAKDVEVIGNVHENPELLGGD